VKIRVLYFAAVRDLLGIEEETLELAPGTAMASFRGILERHHDALAGLLGGVRFARNEAFAEENEVIGEGDVVAVIPPVAGG